MVQTTRRACTKFRHERMHSPDWRSMCFLWTSEGISSAAVVLMECSVFTTMRCDKTPRLGHRLTLKCLGCIDVEKVGSKGALEQRSREQRNEHHQAGISPTSLIASQLPFNKIASSQSRCVCEVGSKIEGQQRPKSR